MKVSAKVTSVGLESALLKRLKEVEGGVDTALNKIAASIKDEAKTTSEFSDKSGRLRSSIRKQKIEGGYAVKAGAKHAHLVEFGHGLVAWGNPTGKRVAPRPFLRNSVDKKLAEAPTILREIK